MGAAEIAEYLGGLSRQRVHQIVNKPKPKFPDPVAVLAMGKVWRASEVEKWAEKYRADLPKQKGRR
jgi:predicted DNA-binding transcriptional regulator AlpA